MVDAINAFKNRWGHRLQRKTISDIESASRLCAELQLDSKIYRDPKRLEILRNRYHAIAGRRKTMGFFAAHLPFTMRQFIVNFYDDPQFLKVWSAWMNQKDDENFRPVVDHKIPVSHFRAGHDGDPDELSNLGFYTHGENQMKADKTEKEWLVYRTAKKISVPFCLQDVLRDAGKNTSHAQNIAKCSRRQLSFF